VDDIHSLTPDHKARRSAAGKMNWGLADVEEPRFRRVCWNYCAFWYLSNSSFPGRSTRK